MDFAQTSISLEFCQLDFLLSFLIFLSSFVNWISICLFSYFARVLSTGFPFVYSLVRLVWPNTEELISRPFEGLQKIRLLSQDGMGSPEFGN